MLADRRTRTVVHHEWTLPHPAHISDVAMTLDVAETTRQREHPRATDITVTAADELLVIGYRVEEPQR
ncbi:hypothetical protein [Embleya sp. NPDC020630]|uniref:hypothetical protein n=1 Tax=Embleya sp. NPDC020630 TaxID=3363979 RepID=UPI003792FC99